MKREVFKPSELALAGALGLCLLLPAAPAWAQNDNNNNGAGATTTTTRTESRDERRDDRRVADRDDADTDWGWLGLLGLAGLLGLMPRKRHPVVVEERRDVRDTGARDRGPNPPPRR